MTTCVTPMRSTPFGFPDCEIMSAASEVVTPRRLKAPDDWDVCSTRSPTPLSPLMMALKRNCARSVRAALADDPEAAAFPFFEHRQIAPLCYALRCGCDADIVELLLEYGADACSTDEVGLSPDKILQERYGEVVRSHQYFAATVHAEVGRLNRIRDSLVAGCGMVDLEPFTDPGDVSDGSLFVEAPLGPPPPLPDEALRFDGIRSSWCH
eukprot:TRINITY_DN5889_c1_g1_i3.p1 TRINITY_DN5889_c1_g1~~TRINITY_DN5889_c1_g1_i3.p1  ORF type:complete len:232 (-),score=34.81 TRINITY_DN5889_c1_g1_i3:516-1145(-)